MKAGVCRNRPTKRSAKEFTVKYIVGLLCVLLLPLLTAAQEIDAKAVDVGVF